MAGNCEGKEYLMDDTVDMGVAEMAIQAIVLIYQEAMLIEGFTPQEVGRVVDTANDLLKATISGL